MTLLNEFVDGEIVLGAVAPLATWDGIIDVVAAIIVEAVEPKGSFSAAIKAGAFGEKGELRDRQCPFEIAVFSSRPIGDVGALDRGAVFLLRAS